MRIGRSFLVAVLGLAGGFLPLRAETVIDVMVVYTAGARSHHRGVDGMEAHILASLASSNQALQDSAVDLRFRLVHWMEVDYVESSEDMGADLRALTFKDGVMEEIHEARDAYGADLVCLFRRGAVYSDDGSGVAGLAWLLNSQSGSPSYGFSVVATEYALSGQVFAHEVGHNLGAAHDRDNADGGLYSYSHGYRFTDGQGTQRRTIMAYAPGSRINYFSNPAVTFGSRAAGTATEDNARGLRQIMDVVSRYREHRQVPPVAVANAVALREDEDGDGVETVLLDGSASKSLEGLASAVWTWSGGRAEGLTVEATFPVGATEVTLTLTDLEGLTASASILVEVFPRSPVVGVWANGGQSVFLKDYGGLWAVGEGVNSSYGSLPSLRAIAPFMVSDLAVGGSGFYLFLDREGSVWGRGNNSSGQLGQGDRSSYGQTVKILEGPMRSIAAGQGSGFCVDAAGALWAWGDGYSGEFGLGQAFSLEQPTQIVASGVAQVFASGNRTFFEKVDGTLWAMGNNSYGALGVGSNDYSKTIPCLVVGLPAGVKKVASSSGFTMILMDDGSLWGVGDNRVGQLGLEGFQSCIEPRLIVGEGVRDVSVDAQSSFFVKEDGSLWGMGTRWGRDEWGNSWHLWPFASEASRIPKRFIEASAQAVAAGSGHVLVLRTDGSAWSVGNNDSGQLGDGTYQSRSVMFKAVGGATGLPNDAPSIGEAGDIVSVDWDGDGFELLGFGEGVRARDDWQVAAWKWSWLGQSVSSPFQNYGSFPVGETKLSLEVVDDEGLSARKELTVTVRPKTLVKTMAEYQGIILLRDDGSVWHLPDSTSSSERLWPRLLFAEGIAEVSASASHCLFRGSDGSLWGMGANQFGQLGEGGELSFDRPVQLRPSGVSGIAAGSDFTLYREAGGALWGLGRGQSGQLGARAKQSNPVPVLLVDEGVVAMAGGIDVTVFVKSDGSLWGLGSDRFGFWPDATSSEPQLMRESGVATVAVGSSHVLALDEEGILWGAGRNSRGQLGSGPAQSLGEWVRVTEKPVSSVLAGPESTLLAMRDGSACSLGYLGAAYSGVASLDVASGVAQVVGGRSRLLVMRSDRSLWVAGRDPFNRWGSVNGNLVQRVEGDGTWNASRPLAVAGKDVVVADFGGNGKERVLLDGSGSFDAWQIESWEWSWEGGSGSGKLLEVELPLGRHEIRSRVVNSDGLDAYDSLVVEVVDTVPVASIAPGAGKTLFVDANGALFGGGVNQAGELGLSTGSSSYSGFSFRLLKAQGVKQAAVDSYCSVWIGEDGSVWSMGRTTLESAREVDPETGALKVFASGGVQAAVSATLMAVLLEDGSVWAWAGEEHVRGGLSKDGPAGPVRLFEGGVAKIALNPNWLFALMKDGSLLGLSRYSREVAMKDAVPFVLRPSGARDLSANRDYLLTLLDDGSLWAWGNSLGVPTGQLRLRDRHQCLFRSGVRSMAATSLNCFVVDDEGFLWATEGFVSLVGSRARGPGSLGKLVSGVERVWAGPSQVFLAMVDGSIWSVGQSNGAGGAISAPVGEGRWIPVQKGQPLDSAPYRSFDAGQDRIILGGYSGGGYLDFGKARFLADAREASVKWVSDDGMFFNGIDPHPYLSPGKRRFECVVTLQDGSELRDAVWIELRSSSAFYAWAEERLSLLPSYERQEGDDPDRDGLTNLEEFAFGFDPALPDNVAGLSIRRQDGRCYVEVANPRAGLAYTLWRGRSVYAWEPLDKVSPQWIDGRLLFEVEDGEHDLYRLSVAPDLSE